MFIRQDIEVALPFGAASFRLVNMLRSGNLAGASNWAYQSGQEAILRVGPLGDIPAATKLVRVRFLDPVYSGDTLRIGMRWEATGAAASLYPALDADITMAPSGEDVTTLTIVGAYRPPLGRLGAGLDKTVLNRLATATIDRLLQQLAGIIVHPADAPGFQRVAFGEPAPQAILRRSDLTD
jgi:hypothetical protein